MKFHRVEGKLPSGVAVGLDERIGTSSGRRPSMADRSLPLLAFGEIADFLVDRVAQYSSNVPITFRLDVPENDIAETARVLRAMANELERGE